VVVLKADVVEVTDDLFGSSVLLDLASGIETNHVRSIDLSSNFENLFETVLLDCLFTLVGESDDEVNSRVSVVFLVILCRANSKPN
jgi:hypothetical protein